MIPATLRNKVMKALAFFSSGRDSIVAVKLIEGQGGDVVGICFEPPFVSAQRARQSARYIGLPLAVGDITEPLLGVILSPRHGYGKGLNPCIAAIATIKRETNWKWTGLAVGYSLVLGWGLAVLIYQLGVLIMTLK